MPERPRPDLNRVRDALREHDRDAEPPPADEVPEPEEDSEDEDDGAA
jgi:hypothetical protein